MSTIILGIESSCDDTSAAVIKDGLLMSNVTASQGVHEEFGGVVPELASRAHQLNIVPVVDAALKRAEVEAKDLSAIAFTRGPGLLGSLLVGVSYAKGMALSLGIPLVEVNHLQAHILAHFIKTNSEASNSPSERPIGGTPSNSEASNRAKPVQYPAAECRTGIRFHRGTKPEHSTGCILVVADNPLPLEGVDSSGKLSKLSSNNNKMKLSIITINYNNAEGLRKTMESVLAQTYTEIEYIIVDGASTDGSVDIIRELATRPTIKWVSEKDTGIYNAMNKGIEIALGRRIVNSLNRSELVEDKNKGIKMAKGEYLLFLNSGDYLVDADTLKNVFEDANDVDIIYGDRINVYEDGSQKKVNYFPDKITGSFMYHSMISHQASFLNFHASRLGVEQSILPAIHNQSRRLSFHFVP